MTVIFPILIKTPPYHLCTEVKLVIANFRRKIKTTRWTGGLNRPYKGLSLVVAPLRGHWSIFQSHFFALQAPYTGLYQVIFALFKIIFLCFRFQLMLEPIPLTKVFLLTPSWTGGFFLPLRRQENGLCSPPHELADANLSRLDFNIASSQNASPFFDKLLNLYSFMINCAFWEKTFSNLPDTGG